ncbi:MAG: S1/P1 nuclease [Pseudomonadota bacterium]
MYWAKPLIFLIATTFSAVTFAWGNEGHRTVAIIAEAELTSTTKAQVQQLLALEGHKHLADIASWADNIRGSEPGLLSHAVRIPFKAKYYKPVRDCNRKTRCVIYGIDRSSELLANPNAAPLERLRALKFLVHFVGDIHQPLHAIEQTGQMHAHWGKRTWTLHKIWDTILVRSLKQNPETLAHSLMNDPTLTNIQQGSPEQWAMESHDIARNFIYHDNKKIAQSKESITLTNDYRQNSIPVVKARLTAAGIRLGRLLNQLLPPSRP